MDTKKEFNQIAIALKVKKKSQKMLAEHMGVSEQTVSKWCNNKIQPPIPDLYRIADYLELDRCELLVKSKYNKKLLE